MQAERRNKLVWFIPRRSWKNRISEKCGNSSVGRAQPCQGWGREFESRFPLTKQRRQLIAVFFCFVLSATMVWPSDPQTPLLGVGGINPVREKCPQRGLESRFPHKIKGSVFTEPFCVINKFVLEIVSHTKIQIHLARDVRWADINTYGAYFYKYFHNFFVYITQTSEVIKYNPNVQMFFNELRGPATFIQKS